MKMEMTVEMKHKSFKDLQPGDVFAIENESKTYSLSEVQMKCQESETGFNTVYLSTGVLSVVGDDTLVIPQRYDFKILV